MVRYFSLFISCVTYFLGILTPRKGHKGKFGHEFLEFEFRPDGKMRYANNSNYKNDTMIRKEAYVNRCVLSGKFQGLSSPLAK